MVVKKLNKIMAAQGKKKLQECDSPKDGEPCQPCTYTSGMIKDSAVLYCTLYGALYGTFYKALDSALYNALYRALYGAL